MAQQIDIVDLSQLLVIITNNRMFEPMLQPLNKFSL
jgi:hypothetical protein